MFQLRRQQWRSRAVVLTAALIICSLLAFYYKVTRGIVAFDMMMFLSCRLTSPNRTPAVCVLHLYNRAAAERSAVPPRLCSIWSLFTSAEWLPEYHERSVLIRSQNRFPGEGISAFDTIGCSDYTTRRMPVSKVR